LENVGFIITTVVDGSSSGIINAIVTAAEAAGVANDGFVSSHLRDLRKRQDIPRRDGLHYQAGEE